MWPKTRLLIPALVVALTLGALAASQAAAIGLWQVEGYELESGSTDEATVQGSENYILKSKLIGANFEFECSKQLAEGVSIKGGEPGTGEGTLKFSACTVRPSKCAVTEPIIAPVKTELVESSNRKKAYVLLKPKGEYLALVEPINKSPEACALNGKRFSLTGSVAAEALPSSEEAEKVTLGFPSLAIGSVVNASESPESIGLKLGPETATLSGASTMTLSSKQPMAPIPAPFRIPNPGEFALQNERRLVKIKAHYAETIDEIQVLPLAPTVGNAFRISNLNGCIKAYTANQVCEVEVEFIGPDDGVEYHGLFQIHPVSHPPDVGQGTALKGEW